MVRPFVVERASINPKETAWDLSCLWFRTIRDTRFACARGFDGEHLGQSASPGILLGAGGEQDSPTRRLVGMTKVVLRRVVVFVGVDEWCYWLLLLSTEDCKGNYALHGEYGGRIWRDALCIFFIVCAGAWRESVARGGPEAGRPPRQDDQHLQGDVRGRQVGAPSIPFLLLFSPYEPP